MDILSPKRRMLFLRWSLALASIWMFLLGAVVALELITLHDVTPLNDRRTTLTITVRDWQGKEHPFSLGPKNPYWTPLKSIPEEMKWAVIVAEDASFYQHEGIDVTALREALKYNLEQKRMARGASTITQQLAKNVFLSQEKSLWRKARELLLARAMERELSKGRILELYLNIIELGPMVHGVGHGARHFFNKTPKKMTPAECALLAAILPGPRVAYNPKRRPKKVRRRAAHLLKLMEGRGILDSVQYSWALVELPSLLGLPPTSPPPSLAEEDSAFAGSLNDLFEEETTYDDLFEVEKTDTVLQPAREAIEPIGEELFKEEIVEEAQKSNESSEESVPQKAAPGTPKVNLN